ncbi:ACP S-malonyltransferase [Pigmentiphaga litoralis]|uniref:Malonyl CoA-acyl carrier protein transacylase n=1 Tax=Pigmentiphaga litoralis TaxID=516702 RepID=A0A7Y9IYS9_9BURK|nr:ACP S-malonyltransferase [Pigmentiphaga litoralis]NYE21781.1 [acyl-carrier-protein] S-malonyltransferase [Pigmentiphaga litoralis]NYE84604.1 [acyl-carrier-protein] S-malonyltransferase [Pigmentiphaga litoralis]
MKIAFVFPGQGSQAVGMLNGFAGNEAVQDVVTRASAALGDDLGKLMAEGPADQLNLTTFTQPVMLTAGVAFYAAWRAAGGPVPALVAGHSLGEYAALVAAGSLTLEDAVRLVRVRADAMQSAVPVGTGGMAAILGLDDDTVRLACSAAADDEIVEAVNFNAPAQVVIAGHKAAVERACEAAKAAGAKRALPLPVSAPFHSSLMQPAADVLAKALAGIEVKRPMIPVLNNVDVATPDEPAAIVDALTRQAWHPVRWVETIQAMKEAGVTHIVECGPGKVLAGLVKRIDSSMVGLAITDEASLAAALAAVNTPDAAA